MKSRIKKNVSISLIILLFLTLMVGCTSKVQDPIKEEQEPIAQEKSDNNYPMEIEDGFGNKVILEKQPVRIISIAPSHTEILYALGLDNEIIGVTTYCDYPEEAITKEKVGDAFNVNIEKVLELNPDLVIQYGPGKDDVNSKIRSAGISLLSYEPESIDEVIHVIEELGKVTNSMAQAKIVTVDMMSKRDYIINRVNKGEKLKVFYEVWDEPLQTAGPGSFLDELIRLAGGENIASDAQGAYAQFDLEQLIERNPDVYLTSKDMETKTIESIKARQGYNEINAIKNNKIYILEPNIISRPGPRIVDGLEIVAKSIHPELFEKK